ncbi:MAG: Dynamin-2, partial [Marteilia pararefringens]
LQRGFVGVVNSNSCDEASFFTTDPAYKDIAPKQGTKYLKKLCVALLAKSLKQNASFLDRKVNQLSMIVDRKILANKNSDRAKLMDDANEEEDDSKMLQLILDTFAWVIKKFDMQLDDRIKNGHVQDLRYYMNSSAVDIFKEILGVFPNSLNKYPITVKEIIDIHLDNLSLFKLDKFKFFLTKLPSLYNNHYRIIVKCMKRVTTKFIEYISIQINKL